MRASVGESNDDSLRDERVLGRMLSRGCDAGLLVARFRRPTGYVLHSRFMRRAQQTRGRRSACAWKRIENPKVGDLVSRDDNGDRLAHDRQDRGVLWLVGTGREVLAKRAVILVDPRTLRSAM